MMHFMEHWNVLIINTFHRMVIVHTDLPAFQECRSLPQHVSLLEALLRGLLPCTPGMLLAWMTCEPIRAFPMYMHTLSSKGGGQLPRTYGHLFRPQLDADPESLGLAWLAYCQSVLNFFPLPFEAPFLKGLKQGLMSTLSMQICIWL